MASEIIELKDPIPVQTSILEENEDIIPIPKGMKRCPNGYTKIPNTNNCRKKNITKKRKQKTATSPEKIEPIEIYDDTYSYLYPTYDDPNFTKKITERKEFYDTRYEKPSLSDTIEEVSDKLCNAEFELAPHQMFVRNFLSFQTPYNGLLLYHGLGSGKTCTAISVSEEMRNYLKQMGITQRIIIVASPNVQENFYLQLFDERKLQLTDGLWNIRACTGNKFLSEINPMNMKGLPREKVISQVKRIINTAYVFMGYIEFANYINKKTSVSSELSSSQQEKVIQQKSNKVFKNRLIIIDEVHNIRMTEDNKDKRVAVELMKLVKNVPHMRLLLLSATPMYNSFKEIVWLLNILNANDNRPQFQSKDVFEADGSFKVNSEGEEVGKELLMRKATGYVSFVRGENPYTFPFRIWPSEFEPERTSIGMQPPVIQMNGTNIIRPIELLDLYTSPIGEIQQMGYDVIIDNLKKDMIGNDGSTLLPSFENMEGFGYTLLQRPLEALNIIYPDTRLIDGSETVVDSKELVGKNGLSRIMQFQETMTPLFRGDFEYKSTIYGNIFSPEEIGKYSGKIKNICDSVKSSEGVILIYSQYIDGGLIPIALALEEMGMRRAGGRRSLFKEAKTEEVDAITFKPMSETKDFSTASYVMITGDKAISPDNVSDLKLSTNLDNKDGKKVKVILISQAGSEGLDFKFIRQVHVLEPWYNMNRIEQIIGRAVRTCSHKDLPFIKRNVQIFLYGSLMLRPREEAADMYVYRLAELKSLQIGVVSRALKEISVDCMLNSDQTGFTIEEMNTTVRQLLSSGKNINYAVGDRPYTSTCDYMSKCSYTCMPNSKIDDNNIKYDTYNESFIMMNNDKIVQRIRDAFKDKFFYDKEQLIQIINAVKKYPLLQINAALNLLTEDKNEYLIDMYGRTGRLVNIAELYLFQPLELKNKQISIYDRSTPIEYKRSELLFEPINDPETIVLQQNDVSFKNKNQGKIIIEKMRENFETAITPQSIDVGTDDWYTFCSVVLPILEQEGWERSMLEQFIINHIVESVLFNDFLILINYLELLDDDDIFIKRIREYIRSIEITSSGITGILLQNIGKQQLIVTSGKSSRTWDIAQSQDYEDLKEAISSKIGEILPISEKLAEYVGFMDNFKKDYMVFKIRDMKQKRNTGARCDQASKPKSIKILNDLGESQYTTKSKLTRHELCVIQEFVLRKYDLQRENNKRWFLKPSEALIINDMKKDK